VEQSASPESGRREVIRAGVRRLLIFVATFSAIAVLVGLIAHWISDRGLGASIALGFLLVGGLMAAGGFVSATMGFVPAGFPSSGGYNIRDAGYMNFREHQGAERSALVFGLFGVAFVLIGAVLDSLL
jgi:hypothetical protein